MLGHDVQYCHHTTKISNRPSTHTSFGWFSTFSCPSRFALFEWDRASAATQASHSNQLVFALGLSCPDYRCSSFAQSRVRYQFCLMCVDQHFKTWLFPRCLRCIQARNWIGLCCRSCQPHGEACLIRSWLSCPASSPSCPSGRTLPIEGLEALYSKFDSQILCIRSPQSPLLHYYASSNWDSTAEMNIFGTIGRNVCALKLRLHPFAFQVRFLATVLEGPTFDARRMGYCPWFKQMSSSWVQRHWNMAGAGIEFVRFRRNSLVCPLGWSRDAGSEFQRSGAIFVPAAAAWSCCPCPQGF